MQKKQSFSSRLMYSMFFHKLPAVPLSCLVPPFTHFFWLFMNWHLNAVSIKQFLAMDTSTSVPNYAAWFKRQTSASLYCKYTLFSFYLFFPASLRAEAPRTHKANVGPREEPVKKALMLKNTGEKKKNATHIFLYCSQFGITFFFFLIVWDACGLVLLNI